MFESGLSDVIITYSPDLVICCFDRIARCVLEQHLSREFHLERTAIFQGTLQRTQYQDVAGIFLVRVYLMNGMSSGLNRGPRL